MTDVQGVVQAAKAAAGDLRDHARATGGALLSEAGELGGTLRQGLEGQAEQQKDRIAQRIGALAERVQRSADEMRGSEAWLAELMERGARELGGVAKDMERSDMAGYPGLGRGVRPTPARAVRRCRRGSRVRADPCRPQRE